MDLGSRCFLFYFDGFISYNFPQDLREHALGMLQTAKRVIGVTGAIVCRCITYYRLQRGFQQSGSTRN